MLNTILLAYAAGYFLSEGTAEYRDFMKTPGWQWSLYLRSLANIAVAITCFIQALNPT